MQLSYLPNIISCLRIFLILPFFWTLITHNYYSAFYLFLVAGLTDGLDGLLARLLSCTSRFGGIIDPVADKLLLTTSVMTLAWLGHLPWFLAIFIVARDIWIIAGALSYQYWIAPVEFKPLFISKLNTFFQITLILLLLIKLSLIFSIPEDFLKTFMALVFISTLISFVQYTVEWGRKALRACL